jgi:hypothetical protein
LIKDRIAYSRCKARPARRFIGGRDQHFPGRRPIDLSEGIEDHDLDTPVRARHGVLHKPVRPSLCGHDERMPLVLRDIPGMRPRDAREAGRALAAGVQSEQQVTPGLAKPLELGKAGPIPWRAGGRQQVADHLRRVRFGHAAIFVYPVDW